MTDLRDSSWALDGAELLLKHRDGTVCRVPANRLFAHRFRTQDEGLPELSQEISGTNLSFSKVPLAVCVDAGFLPTSEAPGPECRVVAVDPRGSVQALVADLTEQASDHVVVDGVWYPFTKGSLDEVRRILDEAGVSGAGPITLRQLLTLKAVASDHPVVRFMMEADNAVGLSAPDTAININADLYPYQVRGLRWLVALAREGLGGILADEMGLGKTVQVIALLVAEENALPSLVVAPATLLENWRREIGRFAPALEVLVHHGTTRTGFPSALRRADVIITSYDTLVRDLSLITMVDWGAVVLDEAQNVRNPDARRTAVVKQVPRKISIAVTGTPVENRLEDLWSLCDFAVPGYLGSRESFLKDYANTPADAKRIASLAGPFILRRRVEEVAGDLPTRIDIPQPLELSGWAAREYEELRVSITEEYGASAGFAGLVRLRQFCTHPFVLANQGGDPAAFSLKYARLVEILTEVKESEEKALIFTSFTSMIDLLADDLPRRLGTPCSQIDGRVDVKMRQATVDKFSKYQGPAVLILNPQAGGTGLNISAANHVIHLNPEWNPATQDQASARAHRRGQTRPVTVHQLYTVDTIEEVMMERLTRKRELAASALPPDERSADRADIARALEMSPLLRTERESKT